MTSTVPRSIVVSDPSLPPPLPADIPLSLRQEAGTFAARPGSGGTGKGPGMAGAPVSGVFEDDFTWHSEAAGNRPEPALWLKRARRARLRQRARNMAAWIVTLLVGGCALAAAAYFMLGIRVDLALLEGLSGRGIF